MASRRDYPRFMQAVTNRIGGKHLTPDHIHMLLSVPPKYSIAYTIGYLKGKSTIRIHRDLLRIYNKTGLRFWARGYYVSTVGLDDETIRKYKRQQEKIGKQQLEFDFD